MDCIQIFSRKYEDTSGLAGGDICLASSYKMKSGVDIILYYYITYNVNIKTNNFLLVAPSAVTGVK